MSINIYTEPDTISTPYRPTYFDCSSDLGDISRMIADVYVDGNLVTTIDKDPILGTTNTFRFDVGDVLKKYLTSYFVVPTTVKDVSNDPSSATYFNVRVFEVTESGGVLDTSWSEDGAGTNYETSNNRYSFNGVNQHEQDLSDYISTSSNTKALFCTNMPDGVYLPRVKLSLGLLTKETSIGFEGTAYDGFNGTGSGTTSTTAQFSPINKKVIFSSLLSLFPSTKNSLEVNAIDSLSSNVSETKMINFFTPCPDDTLITWQNHWGEFDIFSFRGRYNEKTKTKTQSITNRLSLDYSTQDRGKKDLSKENVRTFTVYSKTDRPEVVKWLAEIGESVDVRIISDNGVIPINVTKVSSTIEDSERGIYQIAVTYTKSNERINQLG